MPQVSLNRLYKVRSTAWTPVLASTNIPDAAGAYLRSVLPGQRAALQIAGENAKLSADRTRSRFEGLATGIQAFADTYQAVERARERQDADAIRRTQNGYLEYMANNADAINNAERRPTDKNGETFFEGPFTKAIEIHNAFMENNEDYKRLSKRAKAGFDEWYAEQGRKLRIDASAKQAKLQQEQKALTEKELGDNLKAKIAESLDLEDLDKFAAAQNEFLDYIENRGKVAAGFAREDGKGGIVELPSMTPEVQSLFDEKRREARDAINLERLEHLSNALASIDDPNDPRIAEITKHLKAWGMTAEEYAGQSDVETDFHPTAETELLDDASRQHVRALLANGIAGQKKAVVLHDATLTSELAEGMTAAFAEEDPEKRAAAIGHLTRAAGGFRTASARAAFDALWDKTLMDSQVVNLAKLEMADETEHGDLLTELRKRGGEFRGEGSRMLYGERVDKALAKSAEMRKFHVATGEDKTARDGALELLRGMVDEYSGEIFKKAHLETVREAEVLTDATDFREALDVYEANVAGITPDTENPAAQMAGWLGDLERAANGLKTEEGRASALSAWQNYQNAVGDIYLERLVGVMERGAYWDKARQELVPMTKAEAWEQYRQYLPFMDREHRQRAQKALDDSRERMTPKFFDNLASWLGTDKTAKLFNWDKIDASDTGNMVLAPDSEWDDDGTMDIKWGRGGEYDRKMARKVWEVAESFATLRKAGVIPQDMTVAEYLDKHLGNDPVFLDWRAKTEAERINDTWLKFRQMEEDVVWFEGDDIEERSVAPQPMLPEQRAKTTTKKTIQRHQHH